MQRKKSNVAPLPKLSVAEMQKKLQVSQEELGKDQDSRNNQSTTTQKEILNLRNHNKGEKEQPIGEKEVSAQNAQSDVVKKEMAALRERRAAHAAQLRKEEKGKEKEKEKELETQTKSSSFRMRGAPLHFAPAQVSAKENDQSRLIAEELRKMKNNIGFKEKLQNLENFMTGFSNIIRENKTSTDAKALFELEKDPGIREKTIKEFTNFQDTYVKGIEARVKEDISKYQEETVKKHKMSPNKFREISTIARAYQECLFRDLIRHIAMRIQKAFKDTNIEATYLSGAPNKFAIQSLNYYEDFYKELEDIQKFWPGAGTEMREMEMKILFAVSYCNDQRLLSAICLMIMDSSNPDYAESCSYFDTAFKEFVAGREDVYHYIVLGDGLNANDHPWKKDRCSRLEAPNGRLNFSTISPIDEIHGEMIGKVEKRVEKDVEINSGDNKQFRPM